MSLIKKSNNSAVRDNLSLLPKILLYHGFKIVMFDETTLYNVGPAQHTSFW